jgi:hypothetical protein
MNQLTSKSEQPQMSMQGVCYYWAKAIAVGFLKADDGRAFCVHLRDCPGRQPLSVGQRVRFEPAPDSWAGRVGRKMTVSRIEYEDRLPQIN